MAILLNLVKLSLLLGLTPIICLFHRMCITSSVCVCLFRNERQVEKGERHTD